MRLGAIVIVGLLGCSDTTSAQSAGQGGSATGMADGGAAGMGGGGGQGGAGGTEMPIDYCSACALTDSVLPAMPQAEISGIAASHLSTGGIYAHNDSGDGGTVYRFGLDGADLGAIDLTGVAPDDNEDMAVGPCPEDDRCLFVGDIGDNQGVRPFVTIYRLAENEAVMAVPHQLKARYPDGPVNAETLLVHPISGEILAVSFATTGARMISVPPNLEHNVIGDASEAGTVAAPPEGEPGFTGGDVHPEGAGVLLRTFTHVWFYRATAPDAPLAETLAAQPCALPLEPETQGEAVAWAVKGDSYFTLGEGSDALLNTYTCGP